MNQKKIDRDKNNFFDEIDIFFLISRLLLDFFLVGILIITLNMIMQEF